MMKLGLGLYRHMLNRDHYRFAKQAGATHTVAHLSDYFRPGKLSTASGDDVLGQASGSTHWTYDELSALRKTINDEGLELAALENFDAGHRYDVLLDGPKKGEQLEFIKRTMRKGFGFLTENRKTDGLLLPLSVKENITLVSVDKYANMMVINGQAERKATADIVDKLSIKTPASRRKYAS